MTKQRTEPQTEQHTMCRTNYFRVTDEKRFRELASYFTDHGGQLFTKDGRYALGSALCTIYPIVKPSDKKTDKLLQEWIEKDSIYDENDRHIRLSEIDDVDLDTVYYDPYDNEIYAAEDSTEETYLREIQAILPEGETFIWIETTYEGLHDISHNAWIVNRDKIDVIDTDTKDTIGLYPDIIW